MITNDINDKVYIGQTIDTLASRFSKHKYEAKNYKQENLPLHSAMRKYGPEHFTINLVEECEIDELNEREMYYISYYDSYNNGYNATIGGEGNNKFTQKDYQRMIDLYAEGLTQTQVAEICGCEKHTVVRALNHFGVSREERKNRKLGNRRQAVYKIDKSTGEILDEFESAIAAARSCGKTYSANIAQACREEWRTAYGYKWRYKKDIEK